MTETLSPSQIFTPGSYPTHTYVDRRDEHHEQALTRFLNTPGILPSIVGPSKSGKTVLAQSALGDRAVRISGSEIRTADPFWPLVLGRLGESIARTTSGATTGVLTVGGSAEGGARLFGIGGTVTAEGEMQTSRSHTDTRTYAPAGLADAVVALKARGKVLVLDDFHYIPQSAKREVAQQLKEAVGQDMKAVALAVPHRGDDPIRSNTDLRGRIASIDTGAWELRDLCRIAQLGFAKLGIQPATADVEYLAGEAIRSPQLMQALCLTAAYEYQRGITEFGVREGTALSSAVLHRVARDVAALTNAKTAFEVLSEGPPRRGKIRTQYEMVDGTTGDNYVVILRALAEDPPALTFSLADLQNRIRAVVKRSPPQWQQVSWSLAKLNELVDEKLSNDRVMAWDEGKPRLDIIDPYFLYYIRWKVWPRSTQ